MSKPQRFVIQPFDEDNDQLFEDTIKPAILISDRAGSTLSPPLGRANTAAEDSYERGT